MRRIIRNKGFTLIEVALAVFVVAIGVMAVLSLLSAGLNASTKAVADTQASMFAENVFSGLRARSLLAAEQKTLSTNNLWDAFWNSFANGTTNVTVAAGAPVSSMWTNTSGLMVIRAGGPHTQVFANIPKHSATTTGLVNHAFRYAIGATMTNFVAVNWVGGKVNGVVYNWSTPPVTSRIAQVTLRVWDGMYGTTNESEALVFYSEFANQGDM